MFDRRIDQWIKGGCDTFGWLHHKEPNLQITLSKPQIRFKILMATWHPLPFLFQLQWSCLAPPLSFSSISLISTLYLLIYFYFSIFLISILNLKMGLLSRCVRSGINPKYFGSNNFILTDSILMIYIWIYILKFLIQKIPIMTKRVVKMMTNMLHFIWWPRESSKYILYLHDSFYFFKIYISLLCKYKIHYTLVLFCVCVCVCIVKRSSF